MAKFMFHPHVTGKVCGAMVLALALASCSHEASTGTKGRVGTLASSELSIAQEPEGQGNQGEAGGDPIVLSCQSSTRVKWSFVTVSDPQKDTVSGTLKAGDVTTKSYGFSYSGHLTQETKENGVTRTFAIGPAALVGAEPGDIVPDSSGTLAITTKYIEKEDANPCPRCIGSFVDLEYSFTLNLDGLSVGGSCYAINP